MGGAPAAGGTPGRPPKDPNSGSAVGDHDDLEGWKKLLDINATGVFLGTTSWQHPR